MLIIKIKGMNYINKMRRKVLIRHFNKHMSPLMRKFGSYSKSTLRRHILGNQLGLTSLNYVTEMYKGGNVPLFDTGEFAKSSSYKAIKNIRDGVIGIMIKPKDGIHKPSGMTYENFWELVIKGAEWTPSEKQRTFMKMRLRELGIETAGARKPKWKIPGRPFLEQSLNSATVHAKFSSMVNIALDRALRDWTKG